MKKIFVAIGIVASLVIAGLGVYHYILPEYIARTIINEDDVPAYLPKNIRDKIEVIKRPVKGGATEAVRIIHTSGITMAQVLEAIDNVKEQEAIAMLHELNTTELKSTNQVFDMVKRRFPVNFDVEVFRPAFVKRVKLSSIKKGVQHANNSLDNNEMDFNTAKSIIKKILLQKEEEFNAITQKK